MKIKVQTTNEVDLLKVNFLKDELENAHKSYIQRKEDAITKLYNIWRNQEIPTVYRNWIREAARLINESEMR